MKLKHKLILHKYAKIKQIIVHLYHVEFFEMEVGCVGYYKKLKPFLFYIIVKLMWTQTQLYDYST